MGRKNFLFHNTANGAEASAIVYSLVESAKANNINVFEYLQTVLLYMPDYSLIPCCLIHSILVPVWLSAVSIIFFQYRC